MSTHLRLRVADERANTSHAVRFSASPVRIGRNALNDLHLEEPEVSQWHGIFHFSADKISYIDLGSTNGSTVDGKTVAANEPVFLEQGSKVDLGNVKVEVLGLEARSGHDRPEGRDSMEPPTRIDASYLQPAGALSSPSSASANVSKPAAAPVESAEPPTVFDMRPLGAAAVGVSGTAEEPATNFFHQGVEQALSRGAARATSLPASQRGAIVQWAEALTGKPLSSQGASPTDEQVLERVGALLRTFCQAYIELRQGAQRVEQDMGLERKERPDTPPFARATEVNAMLAELMTMDVDHANRVYELNRVFADVAIHQVALFSALMEGVRGVLDALAPSLLRTQIEQATDKTSWSRYWPVSFRKLWAAYCVRHKDLLDTDGFTRELFGSRFARAFYAFTGGSENM